MIKGSLWIFILILVCTVVSCSLHLKEVLIYNPTPNNYTLDFLNDKLPIEIKGNENQTIKLQIGKTSISVNGQEPEEFYLDKNEEYVINPSKSLLFVVDIPYTNNQTNEAMIKIKRYLNTTTDIDGDVYIGRVKRYNDLIFKKEYDYTFETVPPNIGVDLKDDNIAFGKVLMPLDQLISNQLDFRLMKIEK